MSPADAQPFLEAIFARPSDDGPRLVFADFLDDTGDPADADRAEFIRIQIALARIPDDHPRRPELVNRETELKLTYRATWTAHLAGLGPDTTAGFRRGLAEDVSIDAAAFLTHGGELFRRGPVRRVQLRDAAHVLPQLVGCPFLGCVRELDLCGRDLGNGGVNLLVRSPHLANLHALDLSFNGLDDAGVRVLAKASTLPALRELSLSGNEQISSDGVRGLAESPFLAGLVTLDLSGNDVNDSGVRAIVESRSLTRLRSLKIDRNHIGDAGVAALLGSAVLQRALDRSPRLDLRANTIGPVGAGLVANWPGLARVTHLDLGGNYLGDVGLAALLASPHFAALRVLKLARNQITDAGALRLREEHWALFDRLRGLDLSGNRLTRFGQAVLEAAKGRKPLALDLSGNVQAAFAADVPVAAFEIGEDIAALRRRVRNPARRD